MLASSVTSVGTKMQSPPACVITCATCSPADLLSSAMTTFAPSAAIALAVARPMPVPDPVMSATLPARRGIGVPPLCLVSLNDRARREDQGPPGSEAPAADAILKYWAVEIQQQSKRNATQSK